MEGYGEGYGEGTCGRNRVEGDGGGKTVISCNVPNRAT